MKYSDLVEVYGSLGKTSKKLEKASILARFVPRLEGNEKWIYLLRGKVVPDYDVREFGFSTQLTIKAIAKASGISSEKVIESFKAIGDLGDVAEKLASKRPQNSLFSKDLSVEYVFSGLQKLLSIDGKGAVDKKVMIVVELLSAASGFEAKYIVRTILNDLRVGVADAILLDAISLAYFPEDKEKREKLEETYDFMNDSALLLEMARKDKLNAELVTGKPVKVMLPVKVTTIEEAFRICGKPAAFEHKYDGFRVVISKNGKNVDLFTRRLDNVTKQFPDIVELVRTHVKADSCILDSEVVGYDNEKKIYLPFEAISQRIKRKYDIDKLRRDLPVEVNIFDVLYVNGKGVTDLPFIQRREFLANIVKEERWKIRLSTQIISDSEKEVEKFYKSVLKTGEEGIMGKNLNSGYKPGRRVGYMIKLKPEIADLDLVIVGAEYGTGKRAGGLTSFIVACKSGEKFVEVGKVSSGLKEKESEGTTYKEIDALLKPLVIAENDSGVSVKPKVVVSVTYQNIQPSTSYSSGYALRFPRITHYRPERGVYDIASLEDIKREVARVEKNRRKASL